MKQQIALRIDVDLLEKVRRCAAEENRTMTNFIETVLKKKVEQALGAQPLVNRSPSSTPKGVRKRVPAVASSRKRESGALD